jgi:gliding motility-associated protein GldC
MSLAEIKFSIELDKQNIPDKIFWEATNNPNEGLEQTKAISIAVWDTFNKGVLTTRLWTKDMEVFDMKRFAIENIGSMAEMLLNATGDQKMAEEIDNLCKKLTQHVQEEIKKQNSQS